MKLPRDLSGDDLLQLLKRYGYEATRQTGSHIRLTSQREGREHHITIPRHAHLRVGLLNQLLSDVADFLAMSKKDLLQDLFG